MNSKLFPGTLEMLLLEVLRQEPGYGYDIAQSVAKRSGGAFKIKEGSMYPALHRLESRKLLKSYWEDSDGGRRRKYYRITAAGQKALEEKRNEWKQFQSAVDNLLD